MFLSALAANLHYLIDGRVTADTLIGRKALPGLVCGRRGLGALSAVVGSHSGAPCNSHFTKQSAMSTWMRSMHRQVLRDSQCISLRQCWPEHARARCFRAGTPLLACVTCSSCLVFNPVLLPSTGGGEAAPRAAGQACGSGAGAHQPVADLVLLDSTASHELGLSQGCCEPNTLVRPLALPAWA